VNILADVPGVQAFSAPGFSKSCYMEVSPNSHLNRQPSTAWRRRASGGGFYLNDFLLLSTERSLSLEGYHI
jgi:hypothetical protein